MPNYDEHFDYGGTKGIKALSAALTALLELMQTIKCESVQDIEALVDDPWALQAWLNLRGEDVDRTNLFQEGSIYECMQLSNQMAQFFRTAKQVSDRRY